MLTKRQEDTLKRHKKHHTAKHMAFMRRQMKAGKTFTAAHKLAMKKVGKWKRKESFQTLTKTGKLQKQIY